MSARTAFPDSLDPTTLWALRAVLVPMHPTIASHPDLKAITVLLASTASPERGGLAYLDAVLPAAERRARRLSAVEGHHRLIAVAGVERTLQARCSPSLPSSSPSPSFLCQNPRNGLCHRFSGYRRPGPCPPSRSLDAERLDEPGS